MEKANRLTMSKNSKTFNLYTLELTRLTAGGTLIGFIEYLN